MTNPLAEARPGETWLLRYLGEDHREHTIRLVVLEGATGPCVTWDYRVICAVEDFPAFARPAWLAGRYERVAVPDRPGDRRDPVSPGPTRQSR